MNRLELQPYGVDCVCPRFLTPIHSFSPIIVHRVLIAAIACVAVSTVRVAMVNNANGRWQHYILL
jgi:hypothetical protein